MVSYDLLDVVDACLRDVKAADRPFGGVCVVASGDFAQLGPVVHWSVKKPFALVERFEPSMMKIPSSGKVTERA